MTAYTGPWVWHVDLDQSIAAVEVRHHLGDRPTRARWDIGKQTAKRPSG